MPQLRADVELWIVQLPLFFHTPRNDRDDDGDDPDFDSNFVVFIGIVPSSAAGARLF